MKKDLIKEYVSIMEKVDKIDYSEYKKRNNLVEK